MKPPKLHAVAPVPLENISPANPLAGSPLAAEVVDVTPELAKRWLEKNHSHNRSISWGAVEAFANDMRAGEWKLLHQAICFDGEGNLLDGQHRLNAVVQAGVTVRMLVIRNTAGDFHDPIDRGRPRSVATIMGVAHRDVAALNVLRMFEIGYQIHTKMTLAEAGQVATRHHEDLQQSTTIPMRGKLPGAVVAACIWALPVDRERTAEFALKTATGEMIGRGDPCYAFRSWRERNKRVSTWEMALAALNGLRHFITGAPMGAVYTGEAGYRAFCGRRRALRIPNTPSADLVPGANWRPSRARGDEEEEST